MNAPAHQPCLSRDQLDKAKQAIDFLSSLNTTTLSEQGSSKAIPGPSRGTSGAGGGTEIKKEKGKLCVIRPTKSRDIKTLLYSLTSSLI